MKNTTILKMIFKAFGFIFMMILASCSKKTEIKPDTKPIQIHVLAAGNVSAESATLNAEITYLNDEKILDFGFIASQGYQDNGEGKRISMGKNAKAGLIQYEYKPAVNFTFKQKLYYKFYLVTEKKEYTSDLMSFSVKDFWVDQQELITTTLGDSLLLTGNFKQLDNNINVFGYGNNGLKAVEILKREDNKLLLKIPTNLAKHGETIGLYVSYNTGDSYVDPELGLANLSILGKVEFQADKPIYFGEGLSFRSYGLESLFSDFSILVGSSTFSFYSNKVSLEDVEYTGKKLRLGYYNGHDTVFSEQKLELIKPKPSDLAIKQTDFHPGQPFLLNSELLYKFFGEHSVQIKIADSVYTNFLFPAATSAAFYIPKLKQGKYDVEILSRLYPPVILKQALEVRPIAPKIINSKAYYYNDVIEVSGNFIEGAIYHARLNDFEFFSGSARSGKLMIALPFGKFGIQKLSIGIDVPYQGLSFLESVPIDIKGGVIESISPLSAYAGDIITIKGKGLNAFPRIWLTMADLECKVISQTKTEIKFLAPNSTRKGKFPVNIEYTFSNDVIQSKELLELK